MGWTTGLPAGLAAAAAAIATPVLISLLSRWLGRTQPLVLDEEDGSISPDRTSAALIVGIGAAMVFGGVAYGIAVQSMWAVAAIPCLLGLALGGFMSPSLTHLHDVHWNAEGVEGPSSLFGLTLGLERTAIAWRDIASLGETATNYWFVEARDGRRIYWSYLYRGHEALGGAIDRRAVNLPKQ